MVILAIETSCDDTSVALVAEDGFVVGLFSANQDLAHSPYGGIVPEIASRSHTETLLPLIDHAIKTAKTGWDQIVAIAVTAEPGLIGSLMVGVVTAKALAMARGIPLIAVNHIEGHLMAPLLVDATFKAPAAFTFPFLGLVVSGGHTSLVAVDSPGKFRVLGETLDDAAGEAFDKSAKMMGLGYPGGVQVDRLAVGGDGSKFVLPRALMTADGKLNFSFSGLKTAMQRIVSAQPLMSEVDRKDLCASLQDAIVDVLLEKIDRAVNETGLRRVAITGGVSANSRLRERAQLWASKKSNRDAGAAVKEPIQLVIPPLKYCTDNAAMIGRAAWFRFHKSEFAGSSLAPSARTLAESGFQYSGEV